LYCIHDEFNSQEIFLKYTERYPLDSFVKWFLKWAQSLLQKFGELSLRKTSYSRSSLENTCRINMLSPNLMQQCAPPTFASEQVERHISPADKITVQSMSGATNKNKQQSDILRPRDQDDEVYEDNRTELSRSYERRKVSKRAFQESTPHSLSTTTEYAAHAVCKEYQPSTMPQERPIASSSTVNERRLKKQPTRKHPKESTQIDDTARYMDEINLRVDIPQSIHPNSTEIIKVSDKMGVRKTIAVTMEKSDRKGDSDAVDEITISVDPLGLENLFTEEVDTNQDIGVIPIIEKEKVPYYLKKINAKLKSYGGAQNYHNNLKSKAASFSRTDASDETPIVESCFHANESTTENVEVEYQKTLSPLTPLSGSDFLQGTGSAETVPEVEEPLSTSAPCDSEIATTDDGTQYCISEPEEEIDQAVQGGLLNTFAQSVWGMFSAPSSDET
jgi:hypothetical protein